MKDLTFSNLWDELVEDVTVKKFQSTEDIAKMKAGEVMVIVDMYEGKKLNLDDLDDIFKAIEQAIYEAIEEAI